MLKEYEWRGSTWQFEETQAPKDAEPIVPVKAVKPARNKAAAKPPTKAAVPKDAE